MPEDEAKEAQSAYPEFKDLGDVIEAYEELCTHRDYDSSKQKYWISHN